MRFGVVVQSKEQKMNQGKGNCCRTGARVSEDEPDLPRGAASTCLVFQEKPLFPSNRRGVTWQDENSRHCYCEQPSPLLVKYLLTVQS